MLQGSYIHCHVLSSKKCNSLHSFFSCRIKRIEQKDELEQEKVGELSETEKLAEDNGKIREEIEVCITLFKKYYNNIINL